MKKNNKSNGNIQTVNIKIGDTASKKNKTKRRRRKPTKKQEKPPLSNYQYPAVIYRDVPARPQPQEQIKQDANLAKQIQLKFDEEYAKRENEKATKKASVPGAFQSVDDGFGFSQDLSRINKTFLNDSSKPQRTIIEPINIYQRSNLLSEMKKPIVELASVVNEPIKAQKLQPEIVKAEKFNPETVMVDGKKKFICPFCNNLFSNNYNLTRHIKTLHKDKNQMAEIPNDDYDDMPPLEPIPEQELMTPVRTSRRTVPPPDTIVKLNEDLDDISNKIKRETYLQFATDLINRKAIDNDLQKRITLREALSEPSGVKAKDTKQKYFNLWKNNRVNDEIENDFQNALLGGLD